MSIAKSMMQGFYRKAEGKPERLPWHRESPNRVLVSAAAACPRPGRALDVGCGAGVLTQWLAEKGLEVTGIDILPEAITMARSLAEQRRAEIEFVTADLFSYASRAVVRSRVRLGLPALARRRQYCSLQRQAPRLRLAGSFVRA